MVKKKNIKKNYTSNEVGTILEGIRGDFKVFGEALAGVKEKGDATFEAVGKLQEDVAILKEDVSVLKEDVSDLKSDMVIVKGELGAIRGELKEKVGRDEFNSLDKRVVSLEKVAKMAK